MLAIRTAVMLSYDLPAAALGSAGHKIVAQNVNALEQQNKPFAVIRPPVNSHVCHNSPQHLQCHRGQGNQQEAQICGPQNSSHDIPF